MKHTQLDEVRDFISTTAMDKDLAIRYLDILSSVEQKQSELLEVLKWCAKHAYAAGKSFGDVEIVKQAISEAEGEK